MKAFAELDIKRIFGYYLGFIKPQLPMMLVVLGAVIFNASLTVVSPFFWKRVIDYLSGALASSSPSDSAMQYIYIILALDVANLILYRSAFFVFNRLEAKTINDLKRFSFGRLMRHSYGFFNDSFAGSLVQKVNRFARAYERIADNLVFNIVPLAIRITGILVGFWYFGGKILAFVVLWILTLLIIQYFSYRWRASIDLASAEQDSKVTATLADSISNHSTVLSFAGLRHEEERFAKETDTHYQLMRKSWNFGELMGGVQQGVAITTWFAVFFYAIKYWSAGTMTLGTITMLDMYFIQLSSQIWSMDRLIKDFFTSITDASEMVEILDKPYEISNKEIARPIYVERGEIVFDNMDFTHAKGRVVFENFNLKINSGERVALVGPSGSGKSTFVKLLMRYYDPTAGAIYIDDQDLREVTQESLRESIAYVPQEPLLFHRTLRENIRYGRLTASDAEVEEASRLAHCSEFIEALPDKMETYVGERGIKLSGGERQRVAIARAILKNAPILILDEATSSLDSQSENLIQEALDNLMTNRTVIVVAHRLSTIKKMDRIIVLREGKVAEEGNHDYLLKKRGGYYKKLWTMQAGGFIGAAE